jgi:hypothetical protein
MPDFSVSPEEFNRYVKSLQWQAAVEESALRTTERRRVFVSYSHADEHHRQAVEAMLQQHDIAYVVDSKDIDLGDEISSWALGEIRGCSHYLLILSRTSVSSRWCLAEYSMARGAGITTLVYVVDSVTLPPEMSSRVFTHDIERIGRYFAHDVIDPGAVDRFLKELLHIDLSQLDQYVPVAGRERYWELRDRREIEARINEFNPLWYSDDYKPIAKTRLWSIEAKESARWRLELSKGDEWTPTFHDVYYTAEQRALVMEPEFGDLDLIGVKQEQEDGTFTITHAMGTIIDLLYAHRLYGWPMSHDFWQYANDRLISLLRPQPVSATTQDVPDDGSDRRNEQGGHDERRDVPRCAEVDGEE